MICFVPDVSVKISADDSVIDLGTVFKEWVNYPDKSYGAGYSAGWGYNASTGALKTFQNVGFTGYYNPYLMSFTTGTWGIDFISGDSDLWGFAWGLKTWKNSEGTDSYSFYIYEECGHNRWSISYIEEWKPAKNGSSHMGPVYHSTISAKDSEYSNHNGSMGSVGFATGRTLAYGSATVPNVRHRITIDATKTKVTLTNSVADFKLFGTNGSNAVQQGNDIILDAPIQAGSFGPCSASNAKAYFYNLSMEVGEDNGAIRTDFQPYSDGVPTYDGKVEEHITLENTSWLDPDTKATIKSEEWVITYCDPENGDEEIYSGSTPFDGRFGREGEYKIYLHIISSQGLSARKTKYFTVTNDNILTVKYMDSIWMKKATNSATILFTVENLGFRIKRLP